jgi:hypothetical protein
VNINSDAEILPPTQDVVSRILSVQKGVELWFFADQILLDLADSSLTWNQLQQHYQQNHPTLWNDIIGSVRKFQHVLC